MIFFFFVGKSPKNDGHCRLSSLAYGNSFIELLTEHEYCCVLSARSFFELGVLGEWIGIGAEPSKSSENSEKV